MYKPMRKYGVIIILLSLAFACKKPYLPAVLVKGDNYLVVDGFINVGGTGETNIVLSRTKNLTDTVVSIPENRARVNIISATGANYAMNPAPTAKPKPVGEWNHTRIVVNNGHVEHWLNGDKIVEYDLQSDDWKARKAAGKWKDAPAYGMATAGHIALQDHGSEAWFKDIKLRRL